MRAHRLETQVPVLTTPPLPSPCSDGRRVQEVVSSEMCALKVILYTTLELPVNNSEAVNHVFPNMCI
jgi:hypothetical protein